MITVGHEQNDPVDGIIKVVDLPDEMRLKVVDRKGGKFVQAHNMMIKQVGHESDQDRSPFRALVQCRCILFNFL